MEIIIASLNELQDLVCISSLMWEKYSKESLTEKYEKVLNQKTSRIFLLYLNCSPIAFAHCQLRYEYVEGTKTSPVGYLEGIFVKKEYRKEGYSKFLIKSCESWLKTKNCSEFASDSGIDNNDSYCFHMSNDFIEVNRIICYKKYI